MSGIYCLCADFKNGPPFAKRKSFSTTASGGDARVSGCAVGPIDFGDGNLCLLVTTIAESQQDARTKLTIFLDDQGWQPVPIPIDWTKAQMLVSELYTHIRSAHLVTAMRERPSVVDLGKIKGEVARKIEQNRRWNRSFEELQQQIDDYGKTEAPELFTRLMDQCARLHVLPEHFDNGAAPQSGGYAPPAARSSKPTL